MATLRVRTCTWNLGNAPAPLLAPWIPAGGGDADMIICTVQESKYKLKSSASTRDIDATADAGSRTSTAAEAEDTYAELESDDEAAEREVVHSEEYPAGTSPDGVAVEAKTPPTSPSRGVDASGSSKHVVTASNKSTLEDAAAALHHGSLAAYLKTASSNGESAPIFRAVTEHLGPGFVMVRALMMWQIGLAVYVRAELASGVREVSVSQEATGILGVGQNKGAVAIGIDYLGTRLLFLGSHLAAHMKHHAARNANVREVLANIRSIGGPARMLVNADSQFHHTFFMGDLNYRVDLAITGGGTLGIDEPDHRAAVRDIIAAGDLPALLRADQLRAAQRDGKAWFGFREGDIAFQPTFSMKRAPGFQYAAKRVPSWCDRVLWRSLPGVAADVTCTAYEAHPSISSSDHKPVSACFNVTLHPATTLSLNPAASTLAVAAAPRLAFPDGLEGKDLLGLDYTGKSDVYLLFYTEPPDLLFTPAIAAAVAKRTASHSALATPAGASASQRPLAASARNVDGPEGVASFAAAAAGAGAGAMPGAAGAAGKPVASHSGSAIRSKVKGQTINPKWTAAELPELYLRALSPEELRVAHLSIVLMDRDLADADDRMGCVTLPLAAVLAGPHAFNEPVVLDSVPHGTLAGKMTVQWPRPTDAVESRAPSTPTAHEGCRCTVQ